MPDNCWVHEVVQNDKIKVKHGAKGKKKDCENGCEKGCDNSNKIEKDCENGGNDGDAFSKKKSCGKDVSVEKHVSPSRLLKNISLCGNDAQEKGRYRCAKKKFAKRQQRQRCRSSS